METTRVMIDNVDDAIEKTEATLRAQKMLREQLSKRSHTPFVATSFGQGLHKFLAATTSPFAKLHTHAKTVLKDPAAYSISEALDKADKILESARAVPDKYHKDAKKMAIKAAHTQLNISKYEEFTPLAKRVKKLEKELHLEVSRLRPDMPSDQAVLDANLVLGGLGVIPKDDEDSE